MPMSKRVVCPRCQNSVTLTQRLTAGGGSQDVLERHAGRLPWQVCAGSGSDHERRCYCPDDCNCHYSWRPTLCGCQGH
jgi:hypothetical protein